MSEFLRLGANLLFHSIMVDGKSGILEKNMMNFGEWNIASVSSGIF